MHRPDGRVVGNPSLPESGLGWFTPKPLPLFLLILLWCAIESPLSLPTLWKQAQKRTIGAPYGRRPSLSSSLNNSALHLTRQGRRTISRYKNMEESGMKTTYRILLAVALASLGNVAVQAEDAEMANAEAKVMQFVRAQVPEAVPMLKALKEKKNPADPEAYQDTLDNYRALMNQYEELKTEHAAEAEKIVKNRTRPRSSSAA
jgi:hypothetical protein